jgi:hypothetical protein
MSGFLIPRIGEADHYDAIVTPAEVKVSFSPAFSHSRVISQELINNDRSEGQNNRVEEDRDYFPHGYAASRTSGSPARHLNVLSKNPSGHDAGAAFLLLPAAIGLTTTSTSTSASGSPVGIAIRKVPFGMTRFFHGKRIHSAYSFFYHT